MRRPRGPWKAKVARFAFALALVGAGVYGCLFPSLDGFAGNDGGRAVDGSAFVDVLVDRSETTAADGAGATDTGTFCDDHRDATFCIDFSEKDSTSLDVWTTVDNRIDDAGVGETGSILRVFDGSSPTPPELSINFKGAPSCDYFRVTRTFNGTVRKAKAEVRHRPSSLGTFFEFRVGGACNILFSHQTNTLLSIVVGTGTGTISSDLNLLDRWHGLRVEYDTIGPTGTPVLNVNWDGATKELILPQSCVGPALKIGLGPYCGEDPATHAFDDVLVEIQRE